MHFIDYEASGGNDWLITPQLTVKAGDSLTFWIQKQYTSAYPPDNLEILVSTTNTDESSFTTTLENIDVSTLTSSTWIFKEYILTAFVGQQIYIAFKHTNTDGNGMYLDDVKAIATTPPPAVDVKVTSVGLVDTVNLSNPYYTSGTVTNLSPVNATATFTVTRKINPGGYVSTKTVTDLTANKDTTIVFDPWTFMPGTNYTVRDSVFISGDGTATNDTLQGNLIPYELPCKAYEEFPAPVSYAKRGWAISGTSAMYLFYSGAGLVDKSGMQLDATTNKGALYANFYNVSSGTAYFASPTFTPTVLADSFYFDYAYRSYSGDLDELYLETSTDGGNSWSQLDYLPGGSTVGVGMVTDVPSSTQFAPTAASQWRTKQYVLPVGTNKVRFKAVTGYGNNLWLNNEVV